MALQRLDLRNNELSTLEPEIGLLTNLKWIGLDGNPLRQISYEVAAGPCSNLLKLLRTRLADDTSGGSHGAGAGASAHFAESGSVFDSHAREAAANGVLELSNCEATDGALPPGCFNLPALRSLRLSNNLFVDLASQAGPFAPTLTELHLTRNRIALLPPAVADLETLELLDISYNPLDSISPLPGLRSERLHTLDVTAVAMRGGARCLRRSATT